MEVRSAMRSGRRLAELRIMILTSEHYVYSNGLNMNNEGYIATSFIARGLHIIHASESVKISTPDPTHMTLQKVVPSILQSICHYIDGLAGSLAFDSPRGVACNRLCFLASQTTADLGLGDENVTCLGCFWPNEGTGYARVFR